MKPSTDYAAITKVFMDETIHDLLTDDFTPEDVVIPRGATYLISEDKDAVVMLIPRTGVEVEAHIAVLPKAKHKAIYYGRRGIEWVFTETKMLKITLTIPFYNDQTYRYARKLGFVKEGINTMSFMKHGRLQNQWLLGLTKENWICHH